MCKNKILSFLLALILCIPFCVMGVSAEGEVYTVDGKRTVFLASTETVDIDGTTYNTYSTLKSAFAALGTDGGVITVVGEFTDPTSNGDGTFSDVSGRGHVLIKGSTSDAVLSFNHTLSFKGGPTTLDNFKLNCTSTKYVYGSGDTVFGEGFTTGGTIYYNSIVANGSEGKTVFNTGAKFAQLNVAGWGCDVGTSSSATPALAELIINNITLTTNINLGFSNTNQTAYGNVNLFVNGGTISDKRVMMTHTAARPTGKVSVVFNNDMATGFSIGTEYADYVIKSSTGGTVSISKQADFGGAPTFLLTPDEGMMPTVDGTAVLADAEGSYTFTPSVTSSTQTFTVDWVSAETPTSPIFYSIDGVKTGFVKSEGGICEYNGLSVYAFDTFKNACIANSGKAAIKLIVVGEISDNLSIPDNWPSLLTITGADENAIWNFNSAIHPWGKLVINNIAINASGRSFVCDGKAVLFGDGITGTFGTVMGGGSGSPHGGNITITSGTYTKVYAGSDAATTTSGANHYLTINGGDFSQATVIDGGSTVETSVPGSVVVTVNGGTFADNAKLLLPNVTSVGGIKAAIIGGGLYETYSMSVDEGYDYIIKSDVGGTVAYDGTDFIITPDEGKAALVNGTLSISGKIETGTPGTYNVTWIDSAGTPAVYTIDGVKTAYVKTGGGLFKIADDGTPMYAYDDILTAVSAAVGGKVVVIGEYSGHLGSFWSGSGTTTVCGYDENAVWSMTKGLYNWTPLVIENIILDGTSRSLQADSRVLKIGKNVTMRQPFTVTGGGGATNRNIDVTIESGTYNTLNLGNSGNLGSSGLSYTMTSRLDGGDFSAATVNFGNPSSGALYGNLLAQVYGGTFTEGQSLLLNNIDVKGKSTLIIGNGLDDTYGFNVSENFSVVVKMASGGSVEVADLGGLTQPTFIFTPDDVAKTPAVNGTKITANASGKFYYTPDDSDTQTVLNVTWIVDTDPKAYAVDGVLTAFVADTSPMNIGGIDYYTFDNLTDAVAALGGVAGEVVLATDVTLSGGDSAAFIDTANREPITIKGYSGSEVLGIDGTFGFKGDVTLDNFTLCVLKSTYAKNLNGWSNVTFGENFKVDTENGGYVYFSSSSYRTVTDNQTITVNGGTFNTFNLAGSYSTLHPGVLVKAILNGGSITNSINLGMSEKNDGNTLGSDINVEINADVSTSKQISFDSSKTTVVGNPTISVIFNNGISDYTFTDEANAVVDYKVYSAVGGKVSLYDGTEATTFVLTPDGDNIPKVNGSFIPETDGNYLYSPTEASEEITVTWATAEETVPTVYDIGGERFAFVKENGGIATYGGEVRFAYKDINTALAALGTEGGTIAISGNVYFDSTLEVLNSSNTFKDISGRKPLTIIGIDGTSPVLNYYKSMNLKGDLTIDALTYKKHYDGSLWDQGIFYNGYNLTIGESFLSESDHPSQGMLIYCGGSTATFDKAVITVLGGDIQNIFGGTTWSGVTITGDIEINIRGGSVGTIYAGSHGGQSNASSITNGDVDINIYGGSVGNIYTGVNTKDGINGNVTVHMYGGTVKNGTFYHGCAVDNGTNFVNGNSIYVISGGSFKSASFGSTSKRGVTGEAVFIVRSDITGCNYFEAETGDSTLITYAPDGTVEPAYAEDGSFLGYRIIAPEGKDVIIDDAVATGTSDSIYTIPSGGTHTVVFSKLYTISFDINGGSGKVPNDMAVYDGVVTSLPDTTGMEKYNSVLAGWSEDKNAESGSFSITMPERNVKLYAIWSEIKPELSDNSNIENSDAEKISVTSVAKSDYETTAFIQSISAFADTDSAIVNGYSIEYAFSISGVAADGTEVTEFPNGLNVRLSKSVLPTPAVGEALRLYRNRSTVEKVDFTEDGDYIYFTLFESGEFAIVLTKALAATYNYNGVYDESAGTYTLTLTFKGANASYGSFGFKYDSAKLLLGSVTFADTVLEYGKISEADGGFATYYSADGIYQNTWLASNHSSIDASSVPVKIADFVFTVSEGFDSANALSLFTVASFGDTGLSVSDETLAGIYSDGYYLYAPLVASTDVYFQPVRTVFGIETGFNFTVSYALARNSLDSYYDDSTTGYNNEAELTVAYASTGTEAASATEKSFVMTSDEYGNAVITYSTVLENGTYKATLIKNGYISSEVTFTVDGADLDLGKIILTPGDIKSSIDAKCGDGKVDIEDFIRVIRGFDPSTSQLIKQIVDIDESGVVSIGDIALIKTTMVNNK